MKAPQFFSCSLALIACLLWAHSTRAQTTNMPRHLLYEHWVDRLDIKNGAEVNPVFTGWKPLARQSLAQLINETDSANLSGIDKQAVFFLLRDNAEYWPGYKNYVRQRRGAWGTSMFKNPTAFLQVDTTDFQLFVDPVLYFSGGIEQGTDQPTFINTRGAELRGTIGKKIGFYSFVGENQARFPTYVQQYTDSNLVVPREGFWKPFNNDGVDFFTAAGYVSFQAAKPVNLQFGHDRFFIGNGHRSLIMSDFAPQYLFFKINTQIWKIQYTNLYGRLRANVISSPNGTLAGDPYPVKYMAMHRLDVRLWPEFYLGVFEMVFYGNEDERFDLDYLNPIIFYRSIEQQGGSTGNALLGLDFKWNIARTAQLYGQFMLDEFLLSEFRANRGWWGNKFAVQAGLKYIDVAGIPNLDLQLEGNWARPYTYTHESDFTNVAHYRQPLAHPMGANFTEQIGIVRWQPSLRWQLEGKLARTTFGADSAGSNWGANVLLPYTTRELQVGNTTGQGVATTMWYAEGRVSWMAFPDLFIDARLTYRDLASALPQRSNNTLWGNLALRWNIPMRTHHF